MPVNPATTARKLISMPHELVGRVQEYRFEHRINTETEAIRQLIERGLEAVKADAAKTPKRAA